MLTSFPGFNMQLCLFIGMHNGLHTAHLRLFVLGDSVVESMSADYLSLG